MEHHEAGNFDLMAGPYTASVKQLAGRKALNVEFRHPLRNDSSNRPGRKVHRALGTDDPAEAQRLVASINEILRNESLWSVGARATAEKLYGPKVAEIFYGGLDVPIVARTAESGPIEIPPTSEGYARVLLLGTPGAGKTTLIRQFIGTNPKTERFPATSANRTTTFPTEIILKAGDYEAFVTFMSEHETRFEVEEAVSAAIFEAIQESGPEVARALLEKSDMRFRLKYILGDYKADEPTLDPYDDEQDDDVDLDSVDVLSEVEHRKNQAVVSAFVDRILKLAKSSRDSFEAANGSIDKLIGAPKQAALDEIQDNAIDTDEFLDIVSEVLSEIKSRFDLLDRPTAQLSRTTTGWLRSLHVRFPSAERATFLRLARSVSDNHFLSWGRLVTPLVTAMRIRGPFKPTWADDMPRLVLMDTEGLGHKASDTPDVPEHILPLLDAADVILLVESAKNGMTNIAAGKTLETVVNSGHARKLAVVFTGMDLVKGDNLKGAAKRDHVLAGLRNVIENQISKNVSADAARSLLEHLRVRTFFLGHLDRRDPVAAKPDLNQLLNFLSDFQAPLVPIVAFPVYRDDKLGFAIQEAAGEFRQLWKGYLGLIPSVPAQHYNSIKALSRRYAEGWNDGFSLQPSLNLLSALRGAISRYLESPENWSGTPTPEQKRETIDRLKVAVSQELRKLSTRRVRTNPKPMWQEAYALKGRGSTKPRAARIEALFEKQVPVPRASSSDREVWEFLDETKDAVSRAIANLKKEMETPSGR